MAPPLGMGLPGTAGDLQLQHQARPEYRRVFHREILVLYHALRYELVDEIFIRLPLQSRAFIEVPNEILDKVPNSPAVMSNRKI